MSSGLPRPLREMAAIAEAVRLELAPFCSRIETAGSIRRGRSHVRDIELVAVPCITHEQGADLFRPETVNLLDRYCAVKIRDGAWQHRVDRAGRPAFGKRFKRLLVDGVALDLFSVVEPAQWGCIMLIRTGPADFSRGAVTQRYRGGWLPNVAVVRDGAVYVTDDTGGGGPRRVLMPEERDFFAFCGVPYVEPDQRG